MNEEGECILKISVLGSGRWGTFLAWYARRVGHKVLLYGRLTSKSFKVLQENREHRKAGQA